MTEPKWVPLGAILIIHDRQIEQHGGAVGMRDRTLLEAGILRAANLATYGEPTIAELAAAYAFGIAKAR